MKEPLLSWKIQVAFIITGIFVGLLVTAQFRSAIPSSSYPYDEINAQQELMKSYADDQSILKSRIVNLRKQIEIKQTLASTIIEKNNLDILNQLKKEIGLENIKGLGVEITLSDGLFVKRGDAQALDQSLVQAADLRDIVNLLFSAEAEAIAINNQRVLSSTPISSVGNTILVNNFHLLPHFTIRAIGDPELIVPRLNDAKALPDLLKRANSQKIVFSFKVKQNLIVPIYNSDFRLQYIQKIDSSPL